MVRKSKLYKKLNEDMNSYSYPHFSRTRSSNPHSSLQTRLTQSHHDLRQRNADLQGQLDAYQNTLNKQEKDYNDLINSFLLQNSQLKKQNNVLNQVAHDDSNIGVQNPPALTLPEKDQTPELTLTNVGGHVQGSQVPVFKNKEQALKNRLSHSHKTIQALNSELNVANYQNAIHQLTNGSPKEQVQAANSIIKLSLNDEATSQEVQQLIQYASQKQVPPTKNNITKMSLATGIGVGVAAAILIGVWAKKRLKQVPPAQHIRFSENIISLYREGYLSRENALFALELLKL